MSWVFLFVLLATILAALAFRQDIFAPARIYLIIYSLLLAINSLNLSTIQVPWCAATHIFFWGASVMFLAGASLIGLAGKSKFPTWKLDFPKVRSALKADAGSLDWNWFSKVLIASTAIFVVSYIVSFIKTGEIPAFSSTPDDARLAFSSATFLTYYGLYFGPISLMLSAELIMFGSHKGWRLKGHYLAFGIVLLLYLTIITRFDIFRFLIFLVILYHYGRNNLKLWHLVTVLLAILIVFFSASLIRLNGDAIGALNESIKVKLPRNIAWASGFYAYLANDFWNMNYAFERFTDGNHIYPHSLGLGMMRALTFFTLRIEPGLIETFGYDTVMNTMAERVQGLNTVVYVWHIWKDFGPVGVFIVPLVGGILLGKFYLNSLLKPTLFRISMWGCLIAIVILSFHFPIWELWFFYINILMIALAHKRITLFGRDKNSATSSKSDLIASV